MARIVETLVISSVAKAVSSITAVVTPKELVGPRWNNYVWRIGVAVSGLLVVELILYAGILFEDVTMSSKGNSHEGKNDK